MLHEHLRKLMSPPGHQDSDRTRLANLLVAASVVGVGFTASSAITVGCSQSWLNDPRTSSIRTFASILSAASFMFLYSIVFGALEDPVAAPTISESTPSESTPCLKNIYTVHLESYYFLELEANDKGRHCSRHVLGPSVCSRARFGASHLNGPPPALVSIRRFPSLPWYCRFLLCRVTSIMCGWTQNCFVQRIAEESDVRSPSSSSEASSEHSSITMNNNPGIIRDNNVARLSEQLLAQLLLTLTAKNVAVGMHVQSKLSDLPMLSENLHRRGDSLLVGQCRTPASPDGDIDSGVREGLEAESPPKVLDSALSNRRPHMSQRTALRGSEAEYGLQLYFTSAGDSFGEMLSASSREATRAQPSPRTNSSLDLDLVKTWFRCDQLTSADSELMADSAWSSIEDHTTLPTGEARNVRSSQADSAADLSDIVESKDSQVTRSPFVVTAGNLLRRRTHGRSRSVPSAPVLSPGERGEGDGSAHHSGPVDYRYQREKHQQHKSGGVRH